MYRYFKKIGGVGNGKYIFLWNTKIRVKFNGSCLKQDKTTYTHRTIVNI